MGKAGQTTRSGVGMSWAELAPTSHRVTAHCVHALPSCLDEDREVNVFARRSTSMIMGFINVKRQVPVGRPLRITIGRTPPRAHVKAEAH